MGPGHSVASRSLSPGRGFHSGQHPPGPCLQLKRAGCQPVPLGLVSFTYLISPLHFLCTSCSLGFFPSLPSPLRTNSAMDGNKLFSVRTQPARFITSCWVTTLFHVSWGLVADSKGSGEGRCCAQGLLPATEHVCRVSP